MLVSPRYWAVTLLCVPTVKLATDKLAADVVGFVLVSATVPSVVAPSLKTTLPLGVDPLTVAVNTVAKLNVVGLVPEVRAVLELTWLTTCETLDELLALLLVSPAYTAVIVLWVPTLRLDTGKLAADVVALELMSATVPMVTPASLKTILPLGEEPVTVAVSVVAPPNTVGLVPDTSAVLDVLLSTLCVTVPDVLVALLLSPL